MSLVQRVLKSVLFQTVSDCVAASQDGWQDQAAGTGGDVGADVGGPR